MKFFKILLLLFILPCSTSTIQALTANQERAKKVVLEYYDKLERCTQKPEDIDLKNEIKRLFVYEQGRVFNDLLELKKNHQGQKEDDIGHYLTTILSLARGENMRISFSEKIDNDSWEEQKDLTLDDKTVKFNVWVTVEKTVYLLGKTSPLFTVKETLKIQEDKILSILPPSESTIEIDFFKLYNEKKYDQAFDLCLKRVLDGKADEDAYFYLGLMFRKGRGCKDKYASAVRDKLCVYYWTKCTRGQEGLLNLGWMGKNYYLNNSLPTPINFDMMPVYKGDGESYGFMNTKGHMVIPYQYKYAFSFFDNGLALVRYMDKLWGFIDTRGNKVGKRYKDMGAKGFVDGYAIVVDQNSQKGFIDERGNEVVRPQYYFVTNIKVGIFAFMEKKGDKMGLMNIDGHQVLPPTYDVIEEFQPYGLAFVYNLDSNGKIDKIGLIDTNGQLVIPVKYHKVTILDDGYKVRVQETPTSQEQEFPLYAH